MRQNNIRHRIMAVVITLSVVLSYAVAFSVDVHAEGISNHTFALISSRIGWDHTEEIVYNISGDSSVRYCYYSKFEFTNRNGLGDFYRLYIYSSDKVNVSVTKDGVADVNNGFRKIADEPFSISESLPIYHFPDKATCEKYLSGQMTEAELASAALNYKEVQDSLASYDSTIPVPVKGNVNVITVSTVSSIFNYDENEIKQFEEEHGVTLQYDYEVEYFYQLLTKSQINKKNSNLEVAEVNRGVDDFALDKNNLMVAKTTCKEQFEAFQAGGTPTTQKYLCTADSGTYKTSGAVELSNAVTSSPPDYYTIYSIPFSVFSMEYHMQFIVAQVKVTTYYIDDSGLKHTSDDVYFRRCLWDEDNDHYGATYTRIAKDESGNDVFKNSYEMNANGDNISNDLGNIDDSNLLEHIKNGFGLFGTDGYVALAQRFFLGVPNQIWSLIYMAMAVSIILIVFKTMRGN